jgi:hypothetical protein
MTPLANWFTNISDGFNCSGKIALQDFPQSFPDVDDSKLSIIQIRRVR